MRTGEILRRLHWQCWCEDPPPVDVSLAELVEVLPVLIESGSVGLVWPRLAHRTDELAPAGGAVGAALQAGYEAQVAHNARVVDEIARVVGLLREYDVEPVLIKGYAMARLYPSPLVRSAGDIDLVVRDEEYQAAKAALGDMRISFHGDVAERAQRASGARPGRGDHDYRPYARAAVAAADVDLHAFSAWGEAVSEDSFFRAATPVALPVALPDGVHVLVPRVEDHLRALCLHFLRHGGVRPVRLCDIALLMDSDHRARCGYRPYEWERVITGTAREREQVAVVLMLARELLGAPPVDVPGARPEALPPWVTETVLRQWGANPRVPGPVLPEILANMHPRGIARAFTRRWPDAITATLRTGARFDDRPRLPVQLAAYVGQMGYYARETFRHQLAAVREREDGTPTP